MGDLEEQNRGILVRSEGVGGLAAMGSRVAGFLAMPGRVGPNQRSRSRCRRR